ncbi:MAG: glycosyltransferase, partial [candidate division WOR-3 bacterium]
MVLLFGSFGGWLNWGDIIQLKSWLDFYQNLDYQIFVLLNKDALNQDKDIFLLYQKLFPGVNFVFYSSKDKTFEDISGVSDFSQNPIEIFHVYGGGFLNAFWGKTNLEIIEEALFFFRPEYYFITGQQISKEFISYAGEHFSVFKPHILGVRDKLTEAWLKEIGLNPVFTFDDSFEYLKNLSQKFFNKESIFSPVGEAIGIHLNLSYYTLSNSESLTKVKAELELLGKYVKEKDLKVYLLKGYQSYTSQVKDTTKAIDYFFLSRFFPYYEVIDIIGIELNNDWKKFHEIFSKVKFRSFFSSSYHLSLFFQFLGVPSYLFNFNSYYFQKKREIVGEEISLENFLENFEKIRESQIRNLEKNLKVRENLRDIIIKKLDKKELNKENEREKAFMKTYHKILEEFKVENQVEIDKWTDWWMKRAIYEEREKVKLFEEKEDLRKTLERINKKLEEVNKEKEDLRKTLERIYNSRGWKVLSFYYKLKWYFLHTLGLLDRKKNQITEERVEKFNEVESSEFILEIEKKLDGELKGFKILMVTPDIMGPIKSGGIGTAFYELSKLLVEEGAEVTILYALGDYSEEGTIDKWIEFYNKHGIKFIPLKIEEFLYIGTPYFRQIAHKVDLWLKEREKEFDMVIFPEWMGLAYYVLLAKRQNLRYQNLSIIVNTHSPEIWAYEGNYWLPYDVNMVDRDFMERKCVELADYVISPSQYLLNWMKDRKWAFPKNSFVIQNYIDKRLFKNFPKINENSWGRIEKLIFFGRPEPRKGLFIFIKALQLLSEDKRKLIKEIIFLGKPINTENFDSIKYLKEAEESVKIPFKVLSFSRNKSLEFLINQRNSLVVIPSLIENLPYTVLEALNLGIPFIASKVGGIPELIAEEYKDEVLFDPIPAELAKKLENLIGKESKIFKPAKDSDEIKKEWIKFFKSLQSEKNKLKSELIKIKEYPLISVCLVHYERPGFLKEAL